MFCFRGIGLIYFLCFLAGEFLPARFDDFRVGRNFFHNKAAPAELERGDERRPAPAERFDDEISALSKDFDIRQKNGDRFCPKDNPLPRILLVRRDVFDEIARTDAASFFVSMPVRFAMTNPYRLWVRQCQCTGIASKNGEHKNVAAHFHSSNPCPTEFETSYAPERPEIIYCEQCYQAEVV